MLRVKSILHPTDLSSGSADAFRLAQSMARDSDAALVVLHVYPPPVTLTEGVDYGRPNEYLSDLELSLKRCVAQANLPGVRSPLAEGDQATEIVRVAAAEGCGGRRRG